MITLRDLLGNSGDPGSAKWLLLIDAHIIRSLLAPLTAPYFASFSGASVSWQRLSSTGSVLSLCSSFSVMAPLGKHQTPGYWTHPVKSVSASSPEALTGHFIHLLSLQWSRVTSESTFLIKLPITHHLHSFSFPKQEGSARALNRVVMCVLPHPQTLSHWFCFSFPRRSHLASSIRNACRQTAYPLLKENFPQKFKSWLSYRCKNEYMLEIFFNFWNR